MLNCNYKYPSNAVVSKLSAYFSGKGSCWFTEEGFGKINHAILNLLQRTY